MRTFTDGYVNEKGESAPRTWRLQLDIATVIHVRDTLKIDLTKIDQPGGIPSFDEIDALVDYTSLLLEIIGRVEQPQAVEAADFIKYFDGDTVDRSGDALIQAVADFFPSHRRKLLLAVAAKHQQLKDKAVEKGQATLDGLTYEQAEAAIKANLNRPATPSTGPGKSPAQSAT